MSQSEEQQWKLLLLEALMKERREDAQQVIEEVYPYDLANWYGELGPTEQERLLRYLDHERLADVIEELELEQQLEVLRRLDVEHAGHVMDLMENDDLADILEELPKEEVDRLLSGMRQDEALIVRNLLTYPAETAGRLMTNRFIWVTDESTIGETVEKMRDYIEYSETINYVYVVNQLSQLVGVISYRDLILASNEERIADVMDRKVISVSSETDQEDVAKMFERYDLVSLPVVEGQVLVGLITVDDALDVLREEANEDIEKLSASGKSIDFDTKPWTAATRRLPWLILLLFIGLVSGSIISQFEETLSKVVALAFFMPMIAGMTGNTGTQSLAVVVRGLITREVDKKVVTRLIMRELRVGLIIGVTCGILIAIIAYVWQGDPILGLVVGSSLIITLIFGTLAGTIIPLILHRLNIDPAIASGPLITTLNDILSLLVYFGIATAFISRLM
ncbi:magnesium transporter [Exiguobacterium antarcticum]|uniref:magnesium transporter n=1 Tax=Exiguobacterium antarcticum TaxID=132920 RepID=UPI000285EC35|nr:magnesium transporter [Exiguobacterium antarcticum]AFS71646.1 Magnesium transporter [Exiguobacterium antarcticum B7]